MNFKNTALIMALVTASGDCFVSNPVRGSLPRINTPTTTAFGHSTRRYASNTNVMPPPNDEVERLRQMAAKLREEASSLESEQKAAIVQATEKIFQYFDKDNNGSVSVTELKAGLEKKFKIKVNDNQVNQLFKEFDVNGDGALQLEEFVGVDRFRNKLDAIMRNERDMARQQAKEVQAQAEAAELAQAQLELVNDKPPSATDKVVSILPYLFPLVDGLQFGRFLIDAHHDNPLAIGATLAYALYRSIPFGGLISFFALTFLSENPKINKLVRFNLQQARDIDIYLFAPALIAALGAGLLNQVGVSIPESVGEISSTAMFFALLASIGYSSVSSLMGETPNKLPFISKRVEDRMISPEMFDAEGRFAPFDEDGNLKKPNNDKKD